MKIKFLKNSQTNWKYVLIIVILAIIASGWISGYCWWMEKKETQAPEVKLPEEGLPEKIPFWESSVKIFIKPEPTYEESTRRGEEMKLDAETYTDNVYIKDEKTGKETFLMEVGNICYQHCRFGEYHNGNLYIIKEFGKAEYDPTTGTMKGFIRELWKYDKEGRGKKLFSAKGIDFRVHPKEKFIAVESENILKIIDLNTDEVKIMASVETLIHPDLSRDIREGIRDISIRLDYWSGDGRFFWGDLYFTAYPQQFFRIDTVNWEITKYNVSSLHSDVRETAFNPNSGKIVYSDALICFDVECSEEFRQSQQPVTLYLYDLNTGKKEVIDTSTAEWFNPKWLDNNTIEYTKGGEKTTRKLDKNIE